MQQPPDDSTAGRLAQALNGMTLVLTTSQEPVVKIAEMDISLLCGMLGPEETSLLLKLLSVMVSDETGSWETED